jgi:hypothetical protein
MMTVLTALLKYWRDIFAERHLPAGVRLNGDVSRVGN